jgi:putative addiction module component (TIGR02574 family)
MDSRLHSGVTQTGGDAVSAQDLETEALKLPARERIRLAQELWDSIIPEAEADPDLLLLSEEQIQELERRLAEHERDPGAAIPWEEVRAHLRARFG